MSGGTERSEKGQLKKGLCWFEERKSIGLILVNSLGGEDEHEE